MDTEGAIKSVQINRVSLQPLQGPLAAGREYNRKESLQLYLWNFNSTSNSLVAPHRLSSQISTKQHKAETSVNTNNH